MQCEMMFKVLEDRNITNNIKVALCFDTIASNTGVKNGTCILLDEKIGGELIWFAWRCHVHELHRYYDHRGTERKCRICSKRFKRVGLLKGHYAMYHPELGFNDTNNCDICSKIFERKTSLQRHLEKVHKILQNPNSTDRENLKKEKNKTEEDVLNVNPIISKIKSKKVIKKRKRKIKQRTNTPDNNEISETSDFARNDNNLSENSSEDDMPIAKLSASLSSFKQTIQKSEKDFDIKFNEAFSNDLSNDNYSIKKYEDDEILESKVKEQQSINEIFLPNDECIIKTENVDVEDKEEVVVSDTFCMPKDIIQSLKSRTCTICLKVFRYASHLKRHMLAKHTIEKQFKCKTCPSAFSTNDYLKMHSTKCPVDRTKPKPRSKKFACQKCDAKFTTVRYLNSHMKIIHLDEYKKIWSCTYCAKAFETRHDCTIHTNEAHENEKEYLCTECGHRFVRSRSLEIHMRRHRGEKNFQCKFCGRAFVRTGDRDLHERYHTGEKKFKCDHCSLSFVRNYSLKVHLRIHTGEKPYSCETCSRSFAQGNDLKTHIRREHTGERFTCDVNKCGENFLQLYLLTRHKKKVHNIDQPSHIQRVSKVYKIEKK